MHKPCMHTLSREVRETHYEPDVIKIKVSVIVRVRECLLQACRACTPCHILPF